jgi:hypothetical protein
MSEVYRGPYEEEPEANPQEISADIENEIPGGIVERIRERYESWTEEFLKKEEEENLQPLQFIEQTVESFTEQYKGSEQIDVKNSFEIGMMLLALLIEKGAEWGSNKKASVRRVAIKLIQNGDISRFHSAYNSLIPLLDERQEDVPPDERGFIEKYIS